MKGVVDTLLDDLDPRHGHMCRMESHDLSITSDSIEFQDRATSAYVLRVVTSGSYAQVVYYSYTV